MTDKSKNKDKKECNDLNVLAHKIVKEATKEKSESPKKDEDKSIKK